jgi:16S rRNA (cytosine967-C5)-methyltransferase
MKDYPHILRHIEIANYLIHIYDFNAPFHIFLNHYFRQNKKYGSKDRKSIRSLCYGYFRMGWMFPNDTVIEKIKKYQLLIAQTELEFLERSQIFNTPLSQTEFNEKVEMEAEVMFPFKEWISPQFKNLSFYTSHFKEGNVFFRKVKNRTFECDVAVQIHEDCYMVKSATSLNADVDQGNIQIQDISSQEMCRRIEPGRMCWDACAASGGKLIHLAGRFPETQFYASDIRRSIMENLKRRCMAYNVRLSGYSVIDLCLQHDVLTFTGEEISNLRAPFFDTIIADVPCSGSGVWGRNPENLLSFKPEYLWEYVEKQKQIVSNVLPFLKDGGRLYYMTCSVFGNENEGHVKYWESIHLGVRETVYIDNRYRGGDVLFMAVLEKGW